MAAGANNLLNCLEDYRRAFEKQNPRLSRAQLDEEFARFEGFKSWINQANISASTTSLVPQKRSSSSTQFGLGPHPKRSAADFVPSPTCLERHVSAPAGSTIIPKINGAVQAKYSMTRPINIPNQQKPKASRRTSLSVTSNPVWSVNTRPLNRIHELQDMSPTDYLAQTTDSFNPTPEFSFNGPEFEHGELHAPNLLLTTAPTSDYDSSYSPATVTSDGCLTNASPAYSEPMSRNNTCGELPHSFAMFRMDSSRDAAVPVESMGYIDESSYVSSTNFDVDQSVQQFPFVSSVPNFNHFPVSSSLMQPTLSKESRSSSESSISSQSFVPKLAFETSGASRQRALAPKKHNDASKELMMLKLVPVTGEDGVVKHKAEITRTTRQPQQRKTTFCDYCNEHPLGFHGEHELRRHVERQHTQYRKVWICYDLTGEFLSNCKACRNKKTYGANYNAAAHLRRTHFNPCKNKRGGRNKKSENRGGMGGGNLPSMDELKNWMYEAYEVNRNGRVTIQAYAPDPNIPQGPTFEEIGDFDNGFNLDDCMGMPLSLDTHPLGGSYPHDMNLAHSTMPSFHLIQDYQQPYFSNSH